MSFLVAAALAIAFLVIAPMLAHLLRRGRAQQREFPPTSLVPQVPPLARRPGRLEDRVLLALRALLVVGLALLGAMPALRCSRLRVARPNGASVALAIVLDDSLSMRAQQSGGTSRWRRALEGARNLLLSAREGDAVALVLAGRPARLILAPTTDLALARRTLEALGVSDRATDLEGAVAVARSCLGGLPQTERRVVLFSDLAGKLPPSGHPLISAPLANLRAPLGDCGIVRADRRGARVNAVVACSNPDVARNRQLELFETTDAPKAITSARLDARAGTQTLSVETERPLPAAEARLSGRDEIERDDRAPVATEEGSLLVGVVEDPGRSSVITGGPPVIEQALGALGAGAEVRPLLLLPEEQQELGRLGALVVDDPGGLTPEARDALTTWLERGGVALALLGPAAQSASLGLSLEPFAGGAVRWESTTSSGVDPASVAWLGDETKGLEALHARGRILLDSAKLPLARVIGSWTDSHAWLLGREVGRGLVETLGLPSSVAESDLALRPGFLAVLDHLLGEAARRRGPRESSVGTTWTFPAGSKVEVIGPEGPVTCANVVGEQGKQAVLGATGRYRVRVDGQEQIRVVHGEADEILERPLDPGPGMAGVVVGGQAEPIDISREVALAVLLLFGLELVARLTVGRSIAARNLPSRTLRRITHRPVARPTGADSP